MNDLLWYLEITLEQIEQLLESGNTELAKQFAHNAQERIRETYPPADTIEAWEDKINGKEL